LEEALKEVFGEAPIFGTNQNQENQHPTKVAVTTTSNNQSYLLANYNRPVRECCMLSPILGYHSELT
jgi:hypothetical protein